MTLPAPAYYRQWSGNIPHPGLSVRSPVVHRLGSLHEIFHPWPVLKESLFRDQVIRELSIPVTFECADYSIRNRMVESAGRGWARLTETLI
jgi:hypothetical protein